MCKKKLEERRNKKQALKASNPIEINQIYEKQKVGDWTFFSERQHIENLFCQRFNFLIVVYSLFIAAFAAIDGKTNKIIILSLGFVMISLLWMALMRVYQKLMINLKIVYKIENSPMITVQKETEKEKFFPNFNVNPIIGYVVPGIMVLSLILGIVFIFMGWWNVDAAETIIKCQCAAANVVM